MAEQNFKNHTRLVPLYHGVAFLLAISGLIGSVINLLDHHEPGNHYSAALLVVVFIVLLLLLWYARAFALRAQDRAIRAEENFRHYILTGKPLDKQLNMRQIIALRFASDEEFAGLAKRAVDEKLSQKEIKMSVRNWRPDHHRA
jgi:hypothetical protein